MSAALKLAAVVVANLAVWPVAWTVFQRPASTTPISGQRDTRAPGGMDQPDLGEVLDFSAMSPVQAYSRPLFDPDRRPWLPPEPPPVMSEGVEPEIEQPQVTDMPAPAIRLIGVSSSGPSSMTALLQLETSPDPVWVLVGDLLQGWEVGKIDTQSVMLRRGDQQISADLYPEIRSGQ